MWEDVYNYNNLVTAFHKAAKGKRQKKEVICFLKDFNLNIEILRHQIITFTVPLGKYHYFKIYDPKERVICAASFVERIYHHALMNVYHDSFEKAQIEHSYATRPNKGTHLALQKAWENCQIEGYWLKLDVKKFFDTIHHPTLIKQLNNYFIEYPINRAFVQIINSYAAQTDRGLPIGNLTSQYFANFYLSFLDRYTIHHLGIKKYIRYMDDIVIWVSDKDKLWLVIDALQKFIKKELKQNFKPYTINKCGYNLPFLGFLIHKKGLVPNKRNRKKYKKKLAELTFLKNDEEKQKQFWILKQFYEYQVNTHI